MAKTSTKPNITKGVEGDELHISKKRERTQKDLKALRGDDEISDRLMNEIIASVDRDFYTPTDRVYVILKQFEENVRKYPSIRKNKELDKKAKKISKHLSDFYRILGEKV